MVLDSLQRVLGIFIFDFFVLDSVILFRNRIDPMEIMSEICVRFLLMLGSYRVNLDKEQHCRNR